MEFVAAEGIPNQVSCRHPVFAYVRKETNPTGRTYYVCKFCAEKEEQPKNKLVGVWTGDARAQAVSHMAARHPDIKVPTFLTKFGLDSYFYAPIVAKRNLRYYCSGQDFDFCLAVNSLQPLGRLYEHLATKHRVPTSNFIWIKGMCKNCFMFMDDNDNVENNLLSCHNLKREEFYAEVLQAEEDTNDDEAKNEENVFFYL